MPDSEALAPCLIWGPATPSKAPCLKVHGWKINSSTKSLPQFLTMAPTILTLTCKSCGKEFERTLGRENYRRKNKKEGPFCSNKCSVKHVTTFKKGVKNPHAILTDDDIRMIRRRHKYGVSISQLCIITGMHKNTLLAIVNRKTWKHVHDF